MTALLHLFDLHRVVGSLLILLVFGGLAAGHRYLRGGLWYLICLPGAALWAYTTGAYPYLFAFLLGFATAFAELVTKFTDEPLKAIGTTQAFAYHLVNGSVSALALWVLEINGAKVDTPLAVAQAVATAGLGSMLILRSKLFNFKVNDKEVSFGPEQLVKVFFSYMESAIDRIRSRYRVEFVKTVMDNVSFNGVYAYTKAMLDAAQALPKDDKESLLHEIDSLNDDVDEVQNKSYRLGFLLMNAMGEDFVSELYDAKDEKPAWQIAAPHRVEAVSIPHFLRADKSVLYFAYGTNMLEEELRRKLGWKTAAGETIFESARAARLENYALIFNSKTDTPGSGTGNAVPSPGATVEGVVYKLPSKVTTFLDAVEPGYLMSDCSVVIGNKEETAKLFVAAETAPDLRPARPYLDKLIAGARLRHLSQSYIESLEKTPVLSTSLTATAH
jgi:gamma-glutamyl AIG2-like cyclotransferase